MISMKNILEKLIAKEYLTASEAEKSLIEITEGKHDDIIISSFLTIFMMRSVSIDELNGFRNALLNLCVKIDLSDYDTIDLCGTGGDEKILSIFQLCPLFVTAGSGIKVAKHGNYGVSPIAVQVMFWNFWESIFRMMKVFKKLYR